jgi:hypothetical protein
MRQRSRVAPGCGVLDEDITLIRLLEERELADDGTRISFAELVSELGLAEELETGDPSDPLDPAGTA